MISRLLALALVPLASACATTPSASSAAAFSSERIGVEVRGSGPDVVLIPGLSSSPQAWESTIAAMPGYRYHLVHVAAFAGRPAGANRSGAVVAPVAEEIARYIAAARLERPALVGHSLGGTLAMMVAARHPQSVSRVMVVDMMPFMGAMFGAPGATPGSVEPIAAQSVPPSPSAKASSDGR
jgi:pimeloyl-ACP methyl ester carboxylesterase